MILVNGAMNAPKYCRIRSLFVCGARYILCIHVSNACTHRRRCAHTIIQAENIHLQATTRAAYPTEYCFEGGRIQWRTWRQRRNCLSTITSIAQDNIHFLISFIFALCSSCSAPYYMDRAIHRRNTRAKLSNESRMVKRKGNNTRHKSENGESRKQNNGRSPLFNSVHCAHKT